MLSSRPIKIDRDQYEEISRFSAASRIPRAALLREALATYIDVTLPVMWEALARMKDTTKSAGARLPMA